MMLRMTLFRSRRTALQDLEEKLQETIAQIPSMVEAALPSRRRTARQLAVTAAWVAGGAGVLTLGLLAGRELRVRYKFNRRTPYDYYAHSGESGSDLEFGVGI
jgi:ferric-dicitrate binding protein FerR (iron transport regulator)